MSDQLRVLDAGCGTNAHLAFGGVGLRPLSLEGAHVTGLDIDGEALAANPRLHDRIVGSVETYPLTSEAFDVVVCWDVLEHLRRPSLALENLGRALKPGGTMILGFPNVLSFKGIVTKLTPYSFHRWVYRYVYRTDLEPYPTVLRLCLRPSAVRRWAEERGFGVSIRLEDSRILGWRSECRVVLSKPPNQAPRRGSVR